MQALLGRSRWEADALRDRVRADVLEAPGDRDGVLVVDETGFVKKGTHSVGVARQYSGMAGRVENAQVGVFLTYASRFGQAPIDRRLYLRKVWAGDEERRAKASVSVETAVATKPRSPATSWARPSMPVRAAPSCWQMLSTAPTADCGACWRNGASPPCWPCAPTTPCASSMVGRSTRSIPP